MHRNKILMISSSGELGGGPNLMFLLGNRLKNKIEIYYAIPKSNNYKQFLNYDNHIHIKERRISINDLFRIIYFIRKNSINLVHAHGKGAGLIARLLKIIIRIPIIYTYHGIHLKCHSKLNNYFYVLYENMFSFLDDLKVFVSKSEKEYAIKSGFKINSKNIIIPNGVENKKRKEIFINNSNNLNIDKEFTILSISRFVSQKNINEILNIAFNLPNYKFIIIGDGPLYGEINMKKQELNIKNVGLVGLKKNVFKYLEESDIYISTSFYEGLPISIIEAMSVGLPIIASKVVGNEDTIIHNQSGFLYELGNIKMASYYINLLAKDLKLRNSMSISSYLRQKRFFSIDKLIKKHLEIYKYFD